MRWNVGVCQSHVNYGVVGLAGKLGGLERSSVEAVSLLLTTLFISGL